jgi:hypothetical protein
MSRPKEFIYSCFHEKDWFAILIVGIAFAIAIWIVSMIFSPFTREHSLRRFHLASPNFAGWAMMAPIPSMYNFENRIQFTNEMVGDDEFNIEHESWFKFYLNHFPARAMTFGDFAPTCFKTVRHGTFEMSSRYQTTELVTRWEIGENEDGKLQVYRRSENWIRNHEGE